MSGFSHKALQADEYNEDTTRILSSVLSVENGLTEMNEYERGNKYASSNFIDMLVRDAKRYGDLLSREEEYELGEEMDRQRKAFVKAMVKVPVFLEKLAGLYNSSFDNEKRDDFFAPKNKIKGKANGLCEQRKEIASWCLYCAGLDKEVTAHEITKLQNSYINLYMKRKTQKKFLEWADKQTPDSCHVHPILFQTALKDMHQAHKNLSEVQNHLIVRNVRLLPRTAQKVTLRQFKKQDLIQIGVPGMMRGTDKWDQKSGYKYATYVEWWIKAEMERVSRRHGHMVPLSKEERKNLAIIYKKEKKGLALTSEEKALKNRGNYPVSLDCPLSSDSDDCYIDFLPAEENQSNEQKIFIQQARKAFNLFGKKIEKNKCDFDILNDRLLGDGDITLQNIADRYYISRERVRQREANLLKRMSCFQPIRDVMGEDVIRVLNAKNKGIQCG